MRPAKLLVFLLIWAGYASAKDIQDTDWNTPFYANCPLPSAQSVTSTTKSGDQKTKIVLNAGDVGGCSSDAKPRNRTRFRERAELRQRGTLAPNQTYEISFEATLVQGFAGKEETLFQIHGWQKQCNSAPLMMIRANRGNLDVHVLQRQGNPASSSPSRGAKGALVQMKFKRKIRQNLNIKNLLGTPLNFRVRYENTPKRPRISLWMNGQVLIDDKQFYQRPCAAPHVKFGIYRPGKRRNKTSVLLIDDVTIRRAK